MTLDDLEGKRTVVAYVVRAGTELGAGRYVTHDGAGMRTWCASRYDAERWADASECAHVAHHCGGRVVALVRREPRDWAKLVEEHAALTARVASLADVEADRDRLRLACDAIAEERDAWKARAEEAEAPAPARVLRDGEGGCEPLPAAPKPQPAAGLYALSEVGYVLTRRGCDLLDALARGRS